jgi:hypothetical protein
MMRRQRVAAVIAVAFSPVLAQAQQPANSRPGSAVAAIAGGLVGRGECAGIAVGTYDHGTTGFYAYGEVARGSGRAPTPTKSSKSAPSPRCSPPRCWRSMRSVS